MQGNRPDVLLAASSAIQSFGLFLKAGAAALSPKAQSNPGEATKKEKRNRATLKEVIKPGTKTFSEGKVSIFATS